MIPNVFPDFIDTQKPGGHYYIIGSSETVRDDTGIIPLDATCIFLNMAGVYLMLNNQGTDIWLCADETLSESDLFDSYTDVEWGIKIFSDNLTAKGNYKPDYQFSQRGTLGNISGCIPSYGVLKFNGTVAAQAIQLAYFCKADLITLVGVSMMGNKYFDGSISEKHKPCGAWGQLHAIQGLIDHLIDRENISFQSFTETALDIPYIRY